MVMLKPGQKPDTIHENIQLLVEAGYPKSQAVEMAYKHAGVPRKTLPMPERLAKRKRKRR